MLSFFYRFSFNARFLVANRLILNSQFSIIVQTERRVKFA